MRSCNRCCSGKAIRVTYLRMCVCSLWLPACKAHAPCYLVIFGLPGSTTFIHMTSQSDFRQKVIGHKMSLIFATNFGRNFSHSKKNSARYCHKCTPAFMSSTRYSSQIWIKLEYFQHFLYPQISNFMKIRPLGGELLRAERQTRRTEQPNQCWTGDVLQQLANRFTNASNCCTTKFKPVWISSNYCTVKPHQTQSNILRSCLFCAKCLIVHGAV